MVAKLSVTSDVNDPGEPGSEQRLFYLIVRAQTPADWARVNTMAALRLTTALGHPACDSPEALVYNAIACLTERICGGNQ